MMTEKTDKPHRNTDPKTGRFIKGNTAGTGVPKGLRELYNTIKEEYAKAFYSIGGTKAFVRWILRHSKNREKFYEMLIKLMPKEIIGEGFGKDVKIMIVNQVKEEDDSGSKLIDRIKDNS